MKGSVDERHTVCVCERESASVLFPSKVAGLSVCFVIPVLAESVLGATASHLSLCSLARKELTVPTSLTVTHRVCTSGIKPTGFQ